MNTKFKGLIHAKLYSLSEDPNYILRHKIITLAEETYEDDTINAGFILRKGTEDSNYVVRMRTKKAMDKLGL